jgi:proline dehydrogenase
MITGLKERLVRRIASSHMAGPDLQDALTVYHEAAERGWSCTLGPWTDPADSPRSAAARYRNALEAIIGDSLHCYLSVKLPVLGYDYALLDELLELGESRGVRIHLDGMAPDSAARTLAMLERVLASRRNVGCTIPARWRRSVKDIDRIIDFQIPVRIVKGQWTDPELPVRSVRAQFLELAEKLAGNVPLVAVATHDRPLARGTLHRLIAAGSACEMEQMSSLPQNCGALARDLRVPMRLYIPYGFPSLPYNIRHVPTRPTIVAWAVRDLLLGGRRHLSSVH